MGLPVTVYRSTDAGAPQIDVASPSRIINILKACLVDGYGDKDPLEWTLEFEDVGSVAAAFRNNVSQGGSGGFVKVYSSSGADTTNGAFRVKTSKYMGDISSYIDDTGASFLTISNTYHTNTTWQLIGTARAFWFIVDNGNIADYNIYSVSYRQYQLTFFVGDLDSSDPNDASPFVHVVGMTDPSQDSTTTLDIFGTSAIGGYVSMYSCDGSAAGQSTYVTKLPFATGANTHSFDAQSLGVHETLLPVCVARNIASSAPSIAFPHGRGVVPGLFQSDAIGYSSKLKPLDLEFDNVMFTKVLTYSVNNIWLNLEEWYV